MNVLAQDSQVAAALSTLDQWSLLVGVFLPLLIAVVNRQSWRPVARVVVSGVAVVGAAAVTVFLEGDFNREDWVGSLILVAFTAYSSYAFIWKPSGIAHRVETSVNAGRATPQ